MISLYFHRLNAISGSIVLLGIHGRLHAEFLCDRIPSASGKSESADPDITVTGADDAFIVSGLSGAMIYPVAFFFIPLPDAFHQPGVVPCEIFRIRLHSFGGLCRKAAFAVRSGVAL